MIDPRTAVIEKRIKEICRIFVFASSKGGVGKSSCAVTAALLLAAQNKKVGLLDIDFHGASDHIFLGITPRFPEEEGGILPLPVKQIEAPSAAAQTNNQNRCGSKKEQLRFMSITPFTGEHGIPLRGSDVSNAIIELLAVTIWGQLDYLIIDMPPGIGDELLDVIKYIKRAEITMVTTPGIVSVKVVERLAGLLEASRIKQRGVIVNDLHPGKIPSSSSWERKGPESGASQRQEGARKMETGKLTVLGSIPFDPEFENAVGQPDKILTSSFARHLSSIVGILTER